MGSTRNPSDRRSILGRLLESNECRLGALERQGIQVTVDGATVLEFLFDRVRANGTAREFRLNWMLNVAGLLNELETEAYRTHRTGVDLTTPRPAITHLASTQA